MKTIKVVAAVICDSLENTTKIFSTAPRVPGYVPKSRY